MKLNIRPLQTSDLFAVATILSKISKSTVKEINESLNEQQLGFLFMTSALEVAETDVKKWLASVAQVDIEDFDKLPIEAPLEIIEQLEEKENLPLFFQRVKALINRMKGK